MKNETERSNKNNNIIQETSVAQDIVQLLLKIAFIILAVFLIFTFLYGIVRINDVSMKPAIKDGDLVMYYRLDKGLSPVMLQCLKLMAEPRPDVLWQ